jgi:hypothetical protein
VSQHCLRGRVNPHFFRGHGESAFLRGSLSQHYLRGKVSLDCFRRQGESPVLLRCRVILSMGRRVIFRGRAKSKQFFEAG